jgi:hypothetical protein
LPEHDVQVRYLQLQDWALSQYGESKLGDRFPQAEPDFADTDGLERSLESKPNEIKYLVFALAALAVWHRL